MKHTKQILTTILSVLVSVGLVATAAYATTTIGTDIETAGTLQVDGSVTLGDAVADNTIINGRIATGSAAGAALTLDDTYTRSSGSYLRYNITDWSNIGTQLDGLYLRAETNVASSGKSLTGLDVYATANDVTTNGLKGILSYAYLKGTSAKTVNTAYGIHGELTFDASSGTNTITTEAAPGLLKITGGVVDTYTKIQGLIIRAGDMDGADRTYGNAILVEDDSDMSGTITWTRGLKLSAPSTIDIELQNGETIDNATNGTINLAGNVTISGTNTFATGTGAVGLNGITTIATGKYLLAADNVLAVGNASAQVGSKVLITAGRTSDTPSGGEDPESFLKVQGCFTGVGDASYSSNTRVLDLDVSRPSATYNTVFGDTQDIGLKIGVTNQATGNAVGYILRGINAEAKQGSSATSGTVTKIEGMYVTAKHEGVGSTVTNLIGATIRADASPSVTLGTTVYGLQVDVDIDANAPAASAGVRAYYTTQGDYTDPLAAFQASTQDANDDWKYGLYLDDDSTGLADIRLSSGALIMTGAGAPTGACTKGSIYLNSSGGAGTTLYLCETGTWAAGQ